MKQKRGIESWITRKREEGRKEKPEEGEVRDTEREVQVEGGVKRLSRERSIIFGERVSEKLEREREKRKVEKLLREREDRGKRVTEKRKLYEGGGGNREEEGRGEERTRGKDRGKKTLLPEPKLPDSTPTITPEKPHNLTKKKENKNVSVSTTLLPGNKNSDKNQDKVIKSEKVKTVKPLERDKNLKFDNNKKWI